MLKKIFKEIAGIFKKDFKIFLINKSFSMFEKVGIHVLHAPILETVFPQVYILRM